jgi:hypothetical protein
MIRLLSIPTILLASTIWCRAEVAPLQTVNLAFDYPSPGTVTFYIRATNGPTAQVIGVTTNTTFSWTNVTPLAWRLGVTASNIWGEGNASSPLILPSAPSTPSNLRPVTTSFRVVPPVTFERSMDLANWNERFRIFLPQSNGVQVVMQTVTPDSPFAFYRVRALPQIGKPPVP